MEERIAEEKEKDKKDGDVVFELLLIVRGGVNPRLEDSSVQDSVDRMVTAAVEAVGTICMDEVLPLVEGLVDALAMPELDALGDTDAIVAVEEAYCEFADEVLTLGSWIKPSVSVIAEEGGYGDCVVIVLLLFTEVDKDAEVTTALLLLPVERATDADEDADVAVELLLPLLDDGNVEDGNVDADVLVIWATALVTGVVHVDPEPDADEETGWMLLLDATGVVTEFPGLL